MNWKYEEAKPKGILSELIECYWWEDFSNKNPGRIQHVVPDNSIELIFIRSPFYRSSPAFEKQWQVQSHLSGLKTKNQYCILEESPLISIRFKPKGFYLFSKIAPKSTIDNCLSIDSCFGKNILALENQLFQAENPEQRIEILNDYFTQLFLINEMRRDTLFESIAQEIEDCMGMTSIDQLSEKFDVSTKTIQRRFLLHLGITPKKYCRLIRVVHCLKQSTHYQQLTQLAYESDYYDQSHFVRDIKSVITCTPSHFSRSDKGIQSPYFS